ncbi:hypothetical protein AUEXF2481DRAFT_6336 [Aureobasidium subglaciale EXF-2481]|uniref:Nuclear distribution protein RO10 n=1 Tax=Aureobasidium subglaciale (strain EXF-2481) TaxID=1043005 RepID=A0A074Y7I7_AURSE|nr:uncharacterized protein AUEXF2481DRAFT_6336 [Aureobasidium subglaciale EXF-2481]KAI5196206.1 hypothetical protein E4T38_08609 [Aureobasidium subglaciale]KAI5215042.1 hypothetical protein E4T40_08622 [Aureobasidium subglaciale]KAI5218165.1 hypothetical protein E4T41_08476 [Aureobasidium subglaciale]KAI5255883.1 hypothetical protein E4T46_08510 [Aureobasidium subglaciale]KEQ93748.1 hypothetical protein AUEXF2481DRAFT_6336 [Aureobasidium subglaciale EXF-2481]
MSSIAQDTASQTLHSLEQRLQRVHFLLHGTSPTPDSAKTPTDTSTNQSIASRLQALQSSFNSVLNNSKSAQHLVALQSQHQHDAPDMTQDALTALVLSHAPSYQATAARLTSLQDLPVPDPSASAALIHVYPRLQRAANRQEDQQNTIAQLRRQSLALLARWYDLGIITMDDCWTEWEARLMHQEKLVRRAEADKKQADDPL